MTNIILSFFVFLLLVSCSRSSDKEYNKLKKENDSLLVELQKIKGKIEPESNSINNYVVGIWKSNYYVDQFGDVTNEKYIVNKEIITGDFSNSATEGSCLAVQILINDTTSIQLQLYEYCNSNPVKGSEDYIVYVKDSDGSTYESTARGAGDRINFLESEKIFKSLNTTGIVKFRIYETGRRGSGSKYFFSVSTTPIAF